MISRDIIQRLLAIINETRSRVNTLESKENVLLTATQTLTNKTLTTPTIGNFTNAQHAHTDAASGGTIAHSSLTGLTTGDPHTQYALLAGRSGGQSLSGGTAANDDLTLEGTTNATRTTSYVIMQPNGGNVGIGITAPVTILHAYKATGSSIVKVQTADTTFYAAQDVQSSSGAAAFYHFSSSYPTSNQYIANTGLLESTTGSLNLSAASNNSIQFWTNNQASPRMVILGGGNVGIGTTSPQRKLHVAGTIIVDGDEGGYVGTVGFTDVSDLATRSTGVGTIKFDDATNRDSSGFIKIYISTTAYYVPVFSAI
jgi:hypothetical protein